jgi:glycosyltransferase involved in cell wall biosynthesis
MNKNKPKISIVTVTYNAEQYIEKTIKSIIEQDYLNLEYIIIDGASSDSTTDIIKKYEKYISYWISEPDSGIYDAMNKGIDKANGDWIQFLNAGDTLVSSNTLLEVSEFLVQENDLVHGLMWRNKPTRKLLAPYSSIENPLDGCFIWHPTLFTKINIMKKHKFNTNFKIAGDYDFFLKCIKFNYKIKFINVAITDYLENGISQSDDMLSTIEVLFSQTKYTNTKEICNSSLFTALLNNYPQKNLLFAYFQNNLYSKLQDTLKNKKFILYGFGNIGEIVYSKFKNNIIMIVDKNYEKYSNKQETTIRSIEILNTLNDDFIFISVLGREEEIEKNLIKEFHINPSKILKCII